MNDEITPVHDVHWAYKYVEEFLPEFVDKVEPGTYTRDKEALIILMIMYKHFTGNVIKSDYTGVIDWAVENESHLDNFYNLLKL